MSTLATLRSSVASIIGLDNTTSGDQTLIDQFLNEGYANVLRETRCYVQSSSTAISLSADTKDYTLDTGILLIIEAYVTSSGQDYRMQRVSVEQLLEYRRNGTTTASDPPVYYALAGANLLMVYPTPGSGQTVTIYYVPRNDTLSASAESPSFVPTEYHWVIERYALHRAADYDDDTSSEQGQRYLKEYQEGINRMRRDIALKGNHRLPRAVIPGANRKAVPHRNDTDTY